MLFLTNSLLLPENSNSVVNNKFLQEQTEINRQLIQINSTQPALAPNLMKQSKQDEENNSLYDEIKTNTDVIIESLPEKEKKGIQKKIKDAIKLLYKGLPSRDAILKIKTLPIPNVIKEKLSNGILKAIVNKKEKIGKKPKEEQNLIPSCVVEEVQQ